MLLAFWWPSPLRAKSICNRLRYFIPINNCLFQTLGCYFKQRTELDVHHRKCSQPSRRLLDHVPRLPTILKMNIFTDQWPVKEKKKTAYLPCGSDHFVWMLNAKPNQSNRVTFGSSKDHSTCWIRLESNKQRFIIQLHSEEFTLIIRETSTNIPRHLCYSKPV